MKKTMIAALSMLLLAASEPARVDDLGWMAGDWVREADGRWTEESWTRPRGGLMLGHSRSGRGETVREFEYLRLQTAADGTIAYIAQPGGRAPVAFALVRHDAASATFENAAHDYPQRIHYAREGDGLTATISRLDGTQAMRWDYRRR
ncbi:hypothetical protein EAO27_00605 [Sphingopyxis sp. YF1]|uniref:DUF6265 family protein n=1 Tax=Sphingopyxis sp. YF1 TaxID=2482763 RepID=UPI001F603247|nr:DUF6265 family protein [Sphingopyxis sp. YF1]UNU41374.1 hypothetical protein EAO27_00605 [Sphingopyxis sp. YF1]